MVCTLMMQAFCKTAAIIYCTVTTTAPTAGKPATWPPAPATQPAGSTVYGISAKPMLVAMGVM